MKHVLFPLSEFAPGELRAVEVGGREIVLVRTPDGCVHALRDYCPHYGAKLSAGSLQPMVTSNATGSYVLADGQYVARCPWHGYEFDLTTGRCPADERIRIRVFRTTIEDGAIVLEL
jgi:nitrite reductase/ring-hydroxylating ferredoxin subunit